MKLGFWLGLGVLLVGCVAAPATLPPPATPQALTVYHPPALRWMAPRMAQCAEAVSGLALYRMEVPDFRDVQAGELMLWWGDPPEGTFIYRMGDDALQVIVHPERGDVSLAGDALGAVFSGQQANWPDGAPIQVWVYAADDWLWQVFASALQIPAPASSAFLAPDPQAMLEAVAADPDAIGFLPANWSDATRAVQALPLTDKLAGFLRQPVTAVLPDEPVGAIKSWLLCVQSSQP
ncbi:MAG: hypothetical protein ACOYYS_08030 [Chloroflexota bacterium]